MALPATTDGETKSLRTVHSPSAKPGSPDPRKVAAQELAKAQIVLIDAEDALKAAQEIVAAKTKAFDAIRKAK